MAHTLKAQNKFASSQINPVSESTNLIPSFEERGKLYTDYFLIGASSSNYHPIMGTYPWTNAELITDTLTKKRGTDA